MPSVEERVMLGMFGALPPADVHDEMVQALQEMCLAAAKAVYDARYVGPTEEQLDAVAEEAAKRMSVKGHKGWKVRHPDGVRRMSPFEVVRMHEKYIHKNKVRADKRYEQLQEELTKTTETIELLTQQLDTLSTRVFQTNRHLEYTHKLIDELGKRVERLEYVA